MPGVESIRKFFTSDDDYEDNDGEDDDDCEKKTRQDKGRGSEERCPRVPGRKTQSGEYSIPLSLSLSLCLLFFSFFRQCQGTVGRKEKEKCARENAPKRLRSRLCKFMQEPPSPSPSPPKNERKTRRQLRDPRSTQLRGTKRDEMDGESR